VNQVHFLGDPTISIRHPAYEVNRMETAKTMLASLGFTPDCRGQLLSHGLGGVKNGHYDKHDFMPEM